MKKTLVAAACDNGLTFDLGPTTEAFVAADLETILDGNAIGPIEMAALTTVQEGGLLKLDAVKGDRLRELIRDTSFLGLELNEEALATIDDSKWYGVLPSIQKFVGPYDRKSQAMNGLVLALLGVDLRIKDKQQKEEVVLDEPSMLPELTPTEREALKAMTPEQLDRAAKGVRTLASLFGAITGDHTTFSAAAEKTIADLTAAAKA